MTDLTDVSPNLGLPFYQTKQNEFEVQHNEALLMLDALVMLAVKDRDLSAPPGSPALGDRYLVKPTGTGDWAGNDDRVAQYDTGGWNFYAPQAGWTCYVQDEAALLAWNGTAWVAALDGNSGRERLSADRTYHVRADGSDSNDGLSDTSGGAFLTIQKAWDTIVTLDLNGFTATINVGTGTFTGGLNAAVAPVGGNVIVNGNGAANTVVSVTSGNGCIVNATLCNITVQNIKLTGTVGAGVRTMTPSATITIGAGVEFGANSTADIWAQTGQIQIGSNYTKSGNSQRHYHAQIGGLIQVFQCTVTLSGTPAFSSTFASAASGIVSVFTVTYSGSATGPRYTATLNGVINTFGGGASYFPGNTAGSTATGGQYG